MSDPRIQLNRSQYLELEKLHLGAFLPLKGFVNEDEFHGIADRMRLPSGEMFPLPVLLDITAPQADVLRDVKQADLFLGGEKIGCLRPQDLFRIDKLRAARKIFGTDDQAHPGVKRLIRMEDWFVGGRVILEKRIRPDPALRELTPKEARAEFSGRGWRTVVGFQTRNVPHRAHEYLLRLALENVDGLFIQPLIGWKKKGDYTPQAVMTGYQALISSFFRQENVVLGGLTAAMRYAGPREALFHAIIRRNYGCTHFVIGRDHAGVGNFYGEYAAHELARRFDAELGIEILYCHGPYHCRRCDGIVTEKTCPHSRSAPSEITKVNATDIRAALQGAHPVDPNIMRPEIVESLRDVQLFIEASS